MYYSALVKEVAEKAGVTQEVAKKVIQETVGVIRETISKGEPVYVAKLGKFSRVENKARVIKKNAMIKKDIKVPARYSVSYNASDDFKSALKAIKVK